MPATVRPARRCSNIHRTCGPQTGSGSNRCSRRPTGHALDWGGARHRPAGTRTAAAHPGTVPARRPEPASPPAPDGGNATPRASTARRGRPRRRTGDPWRVAALAARRPTDAAAADPPRAAPIEELLHDGSPARDDRFCGLTLPGTRRTPVLMIGRRGPTVEREPQPRVPSSSVSDGVRRPGERPIHSSRTGS
jgi:hypothetical protein